jgi:hypothetical protein
VEFREQPRHEPYGIVAVFVDPFGKNWDLIELAKSNCDLQTVSQRNKSANR